MPFTRILKRGKRKYAIEVESYRENNKIKHRFVRYLGRVDAKGKIIPPIRERVKIKYVCPFGVQLIIKKLIDEYKLDIEKEFLALAIMHIIKPSSINKFIENYYRYCLNEVFNMEITKAIYRKLDMSDDEIIDRELKLYSSVSKEKRKLFYDITNIYFYGTKCYLAKRGYNKEHNLLPQLKIGLVLDSNKHPMFHRIFSGNTSTYKTIDSVLACLEIYDVKKCIFVIDRGFFSKENMLLIKKKGHEVISGVPLKGKYKRIALALKKKMSWKDKVILKNTYIYAKKFGKYLVCYNEPEAVRLKERRYLNGKEAIETDGLYILYSSINLPKEETVKIYFEKDVIEKTFRMLKGILGLEPVRFWLYNKINLHLFICFLSYFFMSLIEKRTRKLGISVNNVIQELEQVYKIKFDGKEKIVTTNKTQEKILKCFNL